MRLVLLLPLVVGCQEYDLVSEVGEQYAPAPIIHVDPEFILLSDVAPASGDQVETVTMKNIGDAQLELHGWVVAGDGAWAVLDPPGERELAPEESTTMTMVFQPGAESSEATLWITSSDPEQRETPVELMASTVAPGVIVSDIGYGDGYLDCPRWDEVIIENTGEADAELVAIGSDDGAFQPDPVALPHSLAPGQRISVGITWTPSAEGSVEAWLAVEEATGAWALGALSGHGHSDPVEFGVAELDYGEVYADCEEDAEARLYNRSTCDVTLTDIAVGTEDFVPESFALPYTLLGEASLGVDVSFYPSATDSYTDTLVAGFAELDPLEVALWGEGILDTVTEAFDVVEPACEPVYLQDYQDLYSWDPSSNTLTLIGPIGASLFDIAIDDWGQLWGVTDTGQLWQVDAATGAGNPYLFLGSGGNGLAVLEDGTLILGGGSQLYDVDWSTGAISSVATSSSGGSSGDVVQWGGLLYWTVVGTGGDHLLEVDPSTGSVTDLGSTGAESLWGIVAPEGDLVAISAMGMAYWLDSSTATVTATATVSGGWLGAAHNPSYGGSPGWVFHLTDAPRSEDDIAVDVNGVANWDWSWDPVGNDLHFEDPTSLSGGDLVEVSYGLESVCE